MTDSGHDGRAPAAGQLAGLKARGRAVLTAWALDRRRRSAAAREQRLLLGAGETVRALPATQLPLAEGDPLRPLLAAVQAIDAAAAARTVALQQSLDRDRQDFADVAPYLRWLVVARGLCERAILRDRLRRQHRERAQLLAGVGRFVFDGAHEALRDMLPVELRDGVVAARTDAATARASRATLLAPWGGVPLPRALIITADEVRTFLVHVGRQLWSKMFLSIPALAALLVTWWLTHTYTASTLEVFRRQFGFGGRAPMDAVTLARLTFWLPLLAAALCSYLCGFLTVRIHRKYALPERTQEEPVKPPPPSGDRTTATADGGPAAAGPTAPGPGVTRD